MSSSWVNPVDFNKSLNQGIAQGSYSGSALPLAMGGTSATTKAAAFDALQPMTTGGDIIYGGASGTGTRLANGSSGQVLTSGGTTVAPTWGAVSLTTQVSGTLPLANGGTAATTKAGAFDSLSPMTTGGDIIYGGASGTGTRLANGTAGQVLTSGGTTVAPTWATSSVGTAVPTANTNAKWDAQVNMSANDFISGFNIISSNGSATVTMTNTSAQNQYITDAAVTTLKLPSATTVLVVGQSFTIINTLTTSIAIQTSTGAAQPVATLSAATSLRFYVVSTSTNNSTSWFASLP